MRREQLALELQEQFNRLFSPLLLEKWGSAKGFEELSFSLKRKRFELLCGIEYRPTPTGLAARIALLRQEAKSRRFKGGVGVLARHISKPSLEACEALGAACFDLAGSCLLVQRGSYIKVLAGSSQRGQAPFAIAAAFVGNRANVIRSMLAEKDRIWSIGTLADSSVVSGGQVSKAIKPLVAAGFVEAKRGSGGIRVMSPGGILDAWAESYVAPGTLLHYTSRDTVEQLETRLAKALNTAALQYAFTGFSGNSILTASGRYNDAAAYVIASQLQVQRLAAELGLSPSADFPKLAIRCTSDRAVLAGSAKVRGKVVASPAQVYLDLLKHPQRGQEAAELLRSMVMKY